MEPYRVFFPVGLLCGWLGVSHWFLYGFGYIPAYSGLGHALILTQSMLAAFAFGFLMTALPKRTQSAPAHPIEIALGAIAIAVSAVAAERQWFVASELAYGGALAGLWLFATVRTSTGKRRGPHAFSLIVAACATGIVGAALIVRMIRGNGSLEAYLVGRQLVQQGVFLCLLVGAGALILPLITGATPPADAGTGRRAWLARGLVAAYAVLLVYSFVAELDYPRGAVAGRAALVAIALVVAGVAHIPRKPGIHRWLAAASVWCAPLGLAASAWYPQHQVAALHVVFIGSIGLLVFSVAAHVTLGHGGALATLRRWSPTSLLFGAAVIAALAMRTTAHLWPERYYQLLGIGAAVWIGGTIAWLALIAKPLLRPIRDT